jgi:hypothetical protein
MASRFQVFDPFGDALLGGGREDALAAGRGGDRPPLSSEEPWTVSPRTDSAEPVTVRSARPERDDEIPVEVDPLAESGEVLRVAAEEIAVEVELVHEEEEEPCPQTLRSPVSEGVSTNVQRSRVA